MLATSARLLSLLALLQTRHEWGGAELADRLGVTTRTVRNDIGRLRDLGYRVRSTPGSAGGYHLEAGNAVPPLLLDDDEAVAAAVSLRAAASGSVAGIEETALRALVKLEQTLPPRLRHRVDVLRAATASTAAAGPAVEPATLTAIADAAYRREQLRFDYVDRQGRASRRRAEAHRLVCTGRRWYLLAWDVDRGDWRTYRADRIRPRVPNGPRFEPREPPEDAAAYVLRRLGAAAWRHRARIRLEVGIERAAELLPAGSGLLHPAPDGRCVWETGSDSLADLAAYVTSFGVPFTVEDSPELRAHLKALAARLTEAAR